MPAFAVKDFPKAADLFAQLYPRYLFLNPLVGPVGIAQDKKIEMLEFLGLLHRAVNHAQAFKDAAHIFVKHRHDNCRRGEKRFLAIGNCGRDTATIAPAIQDVETHDRRAKSRRDVRKQNHEQGEQNHFQAAEAFAPQQVGHEPGRQTGEKENRREKHEPPAIKPLRRHRFLEKNRHG